MSGFKFSLKKTIPFFMLGLVIIFALAAITGIDDVVDAISQVDMRIYGLAFLVQIFAIALWLSKWKILTKAIDLGVRTRRMFPILLCGIFVNTAVPSAKVGGEPLRAYVFSKLGGIPLDKSFASVAADRAVDGIPFVVIVFSSLSLALLAWDLPLYAIVLLLLSAGLVAVVVTAFLYVCVRPDQAKGLIRWIIRRLRRIISKFRPMEYVESRVEDFMEGFGRGMRMILRNKRYMLQALALSFGYWFLALFRMWLVFWALGYSVSFGTIGLAITLGLVLQTVPIPGGLGIVEGMYILIFQAAGIPARVAFSTALLDRGISFWFTSLFSAVGVAWSGIELSRIWES